MPTLERAFFTLAALALGCVFCGSALADDSAWATELSFIGYGLGEGAGVNPSSLNPANELLNIPSAGVRGDFRPQAKLNYADSLRMILDPRLQVGGYQIKHSPLTSQTTSSADLTWTQAYASWNASDQWILSAGVQNYQWGPAELYSPSDPIVHFTAGQRSIFWEDPGRGLIRLNYSPTQNLSVVVIGEVFNNQLTPQNSGGVFEHLGLAKIEYQLSPADYVGLTGGKGDITRSWIGEYGVFSPADGYSLYADAREYEGSDAYYPTFTAQGLTLEQTLSNQNTAEALVDGGVRIEGRLDFRSEFICNSAGYTRSQFRQALTLVSAVQGSGYVFSGDPNYSPVVLLPGLEFPGQFYLYESLRIPDLESDKSLSLSLRYIHSLMDQSGIFFVSGEQNISDHFSLVAELSASRGAPNSEFTLADGISGTGGIKAAF